MRIDKIGVQNFGLLTPREINIPGKPFTIIEGPNEAGKSTLLDFVRYMLFGPYRDMNQYNEMSAQKPAGSLEGKFADGTPFHLERAGYYKQQQELRFTINGKNAPESDLKQRLSAASLEMYRNIYAISLYELSDADTIDQSGMEDKIYSEILGLGGHSLRKTQDALQEISGNIYKPRGKNQIVPELISEWKEQREKLNQLQAGLDKYENLAAQIENEEAELAKLETENEEIKKQLSVTESCLKALSDYLELQQAREQLKNIPDKKLPADGIKLLEKAENDLESLQDQKNQAEQEKKDIRKKLEEVKPDETLAEQDALKEELNQHVEALRDAQKNCENLENEINEVVPELQEILQKLEIDNEDELDNMPASQSVREEIEDYKRKIDDRHAKLEKDREFAVNAAKEEREYENEIQNYEQKLDKLNEAHVPSTEELRIHQNDLEYLEKAYDLLERKNINTKFAGQISFAFTAIMAATGMILWTASPFQFAGILMVVAGILLAVVVPFVFKPRLTSPEIDEIIQKLPISPPVTRDKLYELKNELGSQQDKASEKDRLRQEISDLKRKLQQIAANKEEAETKCNGTEKIYQQTLDEWEEFLKNKGFPVDISPDQALRRIERIEQAQKLKRDKEQKEHSIATYRKRINSFSEKLTKALQEAGMQLPENDEVLLEHFNQWKKLVDIAVEEKRKQSELQRLLEKNEQNITVIDDKITGKNQQLQELLENAGAENAGQFREKYQQQEERYKLEETINTKLKNLKQYCGGDNPEEELAEYWQLGESDLNDKYRRIKETLDEGTENAKKLREKISANKQYIAELEKQGSVSEVMSAMKNIETRLRSSYKEWAAAQLSGKMLERTKHRFQQERQPEVIRNASRYFATITGNRYQGLEVNIEDKEVRAYEQRGTSKSIPQLSRGTREQLLLALRLGLIEEYETHAEPLPLILDDIMVNFDPTRALATANALTEFSTPGRQLLYFTCHPRQEEIFNESEVVKL